MLISNGGKRFSLSTLFFSQKKKNPWVANQKEYSSKSKDSMDGLPHLHASGQYHGSERKLKSMRYFVVVEIAPKPYNSKSLGTL